MNAPGQHGIAADPRGLKHESAVGHVTGRAAYADETHPPQGMVSLWPVTSPHAHARILRIDASRALAHPGVVMVLTAKDVPGVNDTGPILHDEPLIPAERGVGRDRIPELAGSGLDLLVGIAEQDRQDLEDRVHQNTSVGVCTVFLRLAPNRSGEEVPPEQPLPKEKPQEPRVS